MSFIRKTASMLSFGSADTDDSIRYVLIIDNNIKNEVINNVKNKKFCRHCNVSEISLGVYSEDKSIWKWNTNFKNQDKEKVLNFIKIYGEIENEYGTKINKKSFLNTLKQTNLLKK